MKQKSFVINLLLIGVLALSACSKADSPKGNYSGNNGGDGDGGGSNTPSLGDMVKGICSKNPNSQLCQDIQGNAEVSLQDSKAISHIDGKDFYGAKDPVAWTKGGELSCSNENCSTPADLGVDTGSSLTVGDTVNNKYYDQADGSSAETQGFSGNIVAGTPVSFEALSYPSNIGKELIGISFISGRNQYVILPPLKIV